MRKKPYKQLDARDESLYEPPKVELNRCDRFGCNAAKHFKSRVTDMPICSTLANLWSSASGSTFVVGSNGSHFVWLQFLLVQPWAAGIFPWKQHKCDQFQHSSSPSVVSPRPGCVLDSQTCAVNLKVEIQTKAAPFPRARFPNVSLGRWRTCQRYPTFPLSALIIESVWNARQSRKAIFEGSAGTWSNFVKEIVALNTIFELQSAALSIMWSLYAARVAPYWSGLALSASATQIQSLWTYLARQAAGGSLYFPNSRCVRIHPRLLKACCNLSLSQVHGPDDKAGFQDPKPLMWCGDTT